MKAGWFGWSCDQLSNQHSNNNNNYYYYYIIPKPLYQWVRIPHTPLSLILFCTLAVVVWHPTFDQCRVGAFCFAFVRLFLPWRQLNILRMIKTWKDQLWYFFRLSRDEHLLSYHLDLSWTSPFISHARRRRAWAVFLAPSPPQPRRWIGNLFLFQTMRKSQHFGDFEFPHVFHVFVQGHWFSWICMNWPRAWLACKTLSALEQRLQQAQRDLRPGNLLLEFGDLGQICPCP